MTKTIYPALWSFCCPDLYIRLNVICPFKLWYQMLLGRDVRNMFKWQFYPALVVTLHRCTYVFTILYLQLNSDKQKAIL